MSPGTPRLRRPVSPSWEAGRFISPNFSYTVYAVFLLLINVRIETQRGYPSKELFLKSDKLIPSDMPGGRQDIFYFVLQNSAIRCAKVPFLVKILLTNFTPFRKRARAHTHTHTPFLGNNSKENIIHSLMQNVPIRSGFLSWKIGTVSSHKSLPHTHFDGGTSARRWMIYPRSHYIYLVMESGFKLGFFYSIKLLTLKTIFLSISFTLTKAG